MSNRTSGKTAGKRKSAAAPRKPGTASAKTAAGGKRPPRPRAKSAAPEESLYWQIAEAAYFIAERRGFEPGHEIEDWLLAEAEVKRRKRVG
ncbi:MAG TPA: DUF2934 domain-containing protein [Burkholderiales bacterium]|nr:DUF2934 domain-containing protein [Burkholderiales bacterium]